MSLAGSLEELKKEALKRVEEEARRIIEDARRRASEIIRRAEEAKRRAVEEEKRRVRDEVEYDARIVEASMAARNMITRAKSEVIEELRGRVIELLNTMSPAARLESLKRLLREAVESGVFQGRIRVYVVERDRELVERALHELGLDDRVVGIATLSDDALGGVVVESEDGAVSIDNSYRTRIGTVLRRLMPWINSELFG